MRVLTPILLFFFLFGVGLYAYRTDFSKQFSKPEIEKINISENAEFIKHDLNKSFGYFKTGGYRIEFYKIVINGKPRKITIFGRVHPPLPGNPVTMAFSPANGRILFEAPDYPITWRINTQGLETEYHPVDFYSDPANL